jgi:hypothetical protein
VRRGPLVVDNKVERFWRAVERLPQGGNLISKKTKSGCMYCSTLLQLDVRLRLQIPKDFPNAEVVKRRTKKMYR